LIYHSNYEKKRNKDYVLNRPKGGGRRAGRGRRMIKRRRRRRRRRRRGEGECDNSMAVWLRDCFRHHHPAQM